jgi:hypothetical protein
MASGMRVPAALAGLCACVWAAPAVLATGAQDAPAADPPASLRETGLYTDFAARTIDPRNLPYSPQYPLWSDGAGKRRWIHLPEGASIDASDPDVWLFPAGVKLWKEFSFHGRPVETRLMESLGEGRWRLSAYAWTADGSDALLAPERGLRNVVEIVPGARHDIPGVADCEACHQGERSEALGFSALQLSPDRDASAAHAEPFEPGMVDLRVLIDRGLIRNFPGAWRESPPRIEASSPNARAVLGYLHANCGQCHHPGNNLGTADMRLRHSVAPGVAEEPAMRTTVGRAAGGYRLPDAGGEATLLVRPGDPERSALLFRMATRNPIRQMPPLATKLVDTVAVSQVARWIRDDLTAGKAVPGGSNPGH